MHPAPSIIFFTVASGLGFGMLAFLGFGVNDSSGFTAFVFYFIAFALAVGGLISSAFHLGNPQRALKAFTQWKTSWLSREACLSLAALSVMGLYAIGVIFFHRSWQPLGYLGAILSLVTVFGTSMIYGQLKTVPRWSHWTTPVLFILYALTGGAILTGQLSIARVLLVILGIAQLGAWFIQDKLFKEAGSTIESATGLGSIGKVRMVEPPHSGKNYLLKEMVHQIGRKHAGTLRILGLACLVVIPWAIFMLPFPGHVFAVVALLLHFAGALMTRWLFFAQAEHTVGLYYDKR